MVRPVAGQAFPTSKVTDRPALTEAAKEKKAIEKHKETWAKELKRERDMREELAQEEIGNALHLARTRQG